MKDLLALEVLDPSAAGESRRVAVAIARSLGFPESDVARVALVATELATNMLKHAGGGVLLVRSVRWPDAPGVELLALDRGPGIADLGECLRDGHSTAGSAGVGLGAIVRMSSFFDIYAPPGGGAAVLSRLWLTEPPPQLPPRPVTVGAVSVPVRGEQVCGDGWAVRQSAGAVHVLVVDGLGHGPGAAAAAEEALRVFASDPDHEPAECVAAIDMALWATRGAAVAVAVIDLGRQEVRCAGLGNIDVRVCTRAGDRCQRLPASDGIAGSGTRRARLYTSPCPPDAVLLMHSDGVSGRWEPRDYPGLWHHHPALLAGVLYRDHRRIRDDATVVAVAAP